MTWGPCSCQARIGLWLHLPLPLTPLHWNRALHCDVSCRFLKRNHSLVSTTSHQRITTLRSTWLRVVTTRTSSPDACPRLLSLVGALPKNAYGSPIVNGQGQVVAVYVEKADLSSDKSLVNLVDRYHYALCLDSLTGLLNDGLSAWLLVPKKANEDSARENQ